MSMATTKIIPSVLPKNISAGAETQPKVTLTPPEIEAGYSLIPQRDVDDMFGAVKMIGAGVLPSGTAYGHIAKCVGALRSHVNEGNDARQMLQLAHTPKMATGVEGQDVTINDPLGFQQKLGEINRRLCKVKLPGKITDAMLPQKLHGKDGAENQRGIANCLGVLTPWLYEFPSDTSDTADEETDHGSHAE
jgi:hypothetical protein